MVDLERENSVASSASNAPASCLAMILVRSWGVRWGFFLAFPLISVPNERGCGILWWFEHGMGARAIFVFALAFGYFWPSTVHNEPCLLFNWASTETKGLAFCKRFTRLLSKCNQLKSLYLYHDWVDILEGYDERPEPASYEVLIHRIAPHVPMLEQLTIGIQYFDPSRLEEACKVVKPLRTLTDFPHLTHISASAHALLNPSLATGSPTTMTAFPEGLQHLYIHRPGQEILGLLLADLQGNSARLRRLKTLTLQYWKGDPMDPPTLYSSPERAAILQLGTSVSVRWADYNDDPQWFMEKRRQGKVLQLRVGLDWDYLVE
jgi:hypothetical protein